MARGSRRKRRTKAKPKAKVNLLHRDKKKKVLHVVVPPGGTTGLHTEPKTYTVVPLTSGSVTIDFYKKVRGKLQKTTKVVKLKRLKPYVRKVGRGGIQVNVHNKGRKHHHWLKDSG